MVSSRFKAVLPSPTVSLNNKFAELKEKGENAISFGVGEPDATTPEVVIDYAAQKAREGKTHYTSSLGIKELREKIASAAIERKTIGLSSDMPGPIGSSQ